jgi:hypothetical protein
MKGKAIKNGLSIFKPPSRLLLVVFCLLSCNLETRLIDMLGRLSFSHFFAKLMSHAQKMFLIAAFYDKLYGYFSLSFLISIGKIELL